MRVVDAAASSYSPREAMLSNRAARSGGFIVHDWQALRVGVFLLVAFGLPVAFKADEILARRLVDWNSHWWLGAFVATFVASGALALLVHGSLGLRRIARVRRRRAVHPSEPWRWDYEWDERQSRDDDTARRTRLFIGLGIGFLIMFAPWHWIAFAGNGHAPALWILRTLPFSLAALLFDLIAVSLIARGARLIIRRLKYGQGVATFARFPFRTGEQLELHVQVPSSLRQHAVVTATLRCVQERYVTTRASDGDTRTNVQCFELYRDSVRAEPVGSGGDGRALRVRFGIPADVPVTDLASRPCRYWEVDVEAGTDGVDYGARFLVPVY
jgi:succinate dehydrogenase hydrophobic anchor subunit